MTHAYTPVLNLRMREVGTMLPSGRWGDMLNAELARIDAAIGDVCTTPQVNAIKQFIRSMDDKEGMIL